MGDITKKNMESDNKVLIKRNNQAPGFTSSLAGNRSQMLIERYIQYNSINVQEYIKNKSDSHNGNPYRYIAEVVSWTQLEKKILPRSVSVKCVISNRKLCQMGILK